MALKIIALVALAGLIALPIAARQSRSSDTNDVTMDADAANVSNDIDFENDLDMDNMTSNAASDEFIQNAMDAMNAATDAMQNAADEALAAEEAAKAAAGNSGQYVPVPPPPRLAP